MLILTRGAISVPSDLDGVEKGKYRESFKDCEAEIDALLADIGQGRVSASS